MTPPSDALTVRTVGLLGVTGIVALVLGTAYLEVLAVALDALWDTVPAALGGKPLIAGYLLVMLTGGAALVGWLRRRSWLYGHSPLDGLTVSVAPVSVALMSFLLVVVTLLSGAVLGPEAGLLALGTAVGVFVADRTTGARTDRFVTVGAGGAILGLVVSMTWHSTVSLGGGYAFAWSDLLGAAGAAVLAALTLAVVRLAGYRWRLWADPGVIRPARVTLTGLAIAVIAGAAALRVDIDLRMILGSGEGHIADLVALTDAGTVIVIVIAKGIGYALSLGGGLRGGPIFPAMFLGGAAAVLASLAGLPGTTGVLAAAGILAGTSVGLALGWLPLTVSGVVLGLLLGGWALVPAAVVGLAIGRIVGMALERVPGVGPVADPAPADDVAATDARD